jgi:hypothetical protein
LKRNSSKLPDKKSDENTPKIIKKKNDPYNLEIIDLSFGAKPENRRPWF